MAGYTDGDKPCAVDDTRTTVRTKVLTDLNAALEERGTSGLEAWLTDRTVDRFVRANNGVVDGAVCQLCESWAWRVEVQPRWLCCHLCIRDPMAHSLRPIGVDALGRLIVYSCFATSKNRYEPRANVLHMQRVLEDAQVLLDANPSGPGKWVFFVDFHGFGLSDASPSTATTTIALLKHYPERLGLAVLYDTGSLFEGLWSIINPLLNEVTRSKVQFKSSLEDADSLNMGDDAVAWLTREIAENRTDFCETKRHWEEAGGFPDESRPAHDPRGMKHFIESGQYKEFLQYGDGASDDCVPVVDITLDRLFAGKIGVRLKKLTVSGVDVPEAGEFWKVGDEVLEVNGNPVEEACDFGRELKAGIQAFNEKGEPIIVKVFRHGESSET